MHWKKNRLVNPGTKAAIIQRGACPGCGAEVRFYYGENIGQCCPICRREAEMGRADEEAEKRARRDRSHRGG